MTRSLLRAAALWVACVWLAGAAPEPSTAPPSGAASVAIDNFSFNPPELTVAPGTTMVWENRDDIPHTVTGADDPRPFGSGPLDTGDRFSFRFDRPGRFPYFCSLHAHMQGVVVVVR